MLEKKLLKNILKFYQDSENQVRDLDRTFGICLYNSNTESFYHKYNYIIRKLFEDIYGSEKADLIESYIFDETEMDFDTLYKILNDE